ncbi:MAG TPA: hypothetical protein VHP31_02185 [Caproicibacter sp.]|nr:hypothetical protein [Caproicibacter sp.]
MKNLAKKILGIACSAVLCLPLFSSSAFASEIGNSEKSAKLPTKLPYLEQIKDHGTKAISGTKNGTIIITDKKQIAEIAKQQNLNDPQSITKITYDFRDFSNIQGCKQIENNTNAGLLPKVIYTTQKIYNVKDLGSGYSYWDDYDSSIYNGPASVTKTYKRTASSSFTASVEVDSKLVEAAVGFTFVSGLGVEEAYSFTVPANQQIELRVFTNYHEKSYDVGELMGGLLYPTGSGTAQKPVGLIFQQIQR